MEHCPLCDAPHLRPLRSVPFHYAGGFVPRECVNCGRFAIQQATTIRESPRRWLVAAHVRARFVTRREPPILLEPRAPASDATEEGWVALDWGQLVARAPRIEERADLALLNFAAACGEPSRTTDDHAVGLASFCWSPSDDVARWLFGVLQERDWIRSAEHPKGQVATKGWLRHEELTVGRLSPGGVATAFVAMSFNSHWRPLFDEAIAPAVRECGYEPFRVDEDPNNELIDDMI